MSFDAEGMSFEEAVHGLLAGDFSRLVPLFVSGISDEKCAIIGWYESGCFTGQPQAAAEALTCACFNGCTDVAEYLLDKGIDPVAGFNTGMNGFHWAANRGQLETVRLLIARSAPLETKNMYGGTVLGCTVWSALHELRSGQGAVIEALLEAGARIEGAWYPTGDERIDKVLTRYGAGETQKPGEGL